MSKSFRQLLLFAATVVFLAVAPLVVFYAMGYRLADDVHEATIGVLLVETVPRRSRIAVNGREVGTSPQSIANLPPGEVTVSITKDGYSPWQKKITIKPNEVTELRNVRLFPEELAEREILASVTQYSLAPNRQLIAALVGRHLHIIDEDGTAVVQPFKLASSTPPLQLLWSPDSRSLLFISSAEVRLVNITQPSFSSPVSELQRARDIVWDPRLPDRILAISPSRHLIAYQDTARKIVHLAENVSTFATSSRYIFAVQGGQLLVMNMQGETVRSVLLPQPTTKLIVTPSGQVALWYHSGELTVLGENDQLIPVARSAHTASFSPDGQLLVVQTDATSLHVFNVSDDRLRHIPLRQLQLVVRLSRPIRDPQWFAGGQHLMYQAEDEIVITEIDTRDHSVSRTIKATNLGQSQPAVGRDGETLFYLQQHGPARALQAATLIN